MDRYHWLLDHLHDPVSLWAEGFRNTTGLSKEEFLALLDEARASGEFVDEEARGIGRPDPIPLEYKLLMALVKMRQGVSFYSFEASMEISRTVAGNFFHKFCAWLSSPAKYGEQVLMPRTAQERDEIEIQLSSLTRESYDIFLRKRYAGRLKAFPSSPFHWRLRKGKRHPLQDT